MSLKRQALLKTLAYVAGIIFSGFLGGLLGSLMSTKTLLLVVGILSVAYFVYILYAIILDQLQYKATLDKTVDQK